MRRNVSEIVLERIKKKGPGHSWSYKNFPNLSPQAVIKVLSRLEKSGFLTKEAKGLYYYGKETILGKTKPEPLDVAKTIVGTPYIGGAAAYYNLGLTTQVSATINIVAPIKNEIKGLKIIRRNINHLKGSTHEEFWIFEALRNIKSIPDCNPEDALNHIKTLIKKRLSIERLIDFAIKGEPPRVRALIGAISQELGANKILSEKLKVTLNPFTKYKLGLKKVLKFSKEWGIE
jgi:hypothetical protein